MTELVGQTHTTIIAVASIRIGCKKVPPFAFLEGFPGVGKSSLAYALMRKVEGLEAIGGSWKLDSCEGGHA